MTLHRVKRIAIAALLLSLGSTVTLLYAAFGQSSSPATGGELKDASACARSKLVGEYVRHKMQPDMSGMRPLLRSDVAAAEAGCARETSPPESNVLNEQAEALEVPDLAPGAQTPPQTPAATAAETQQLEQTK